MRGRDGERMDRSDRCALRRSSAWRCRRRRLEVDAGYTEISVVQGDGGEERHATWPIGFRGTP
jgi:hypothetical protein